VGRGGRAETPWKNCGKGKKGRDPMARWEGEEGPATYQEVQKGRKRVGRLTGGPGEKSEKGQATYLEVPERRARKGRPPTWRSRREE
jgi:hypothetical protein